MTDQKTPPNNGNGKKGKELERVKQPVDLIQQEGARAIARRNALNHLFKQIRGADWGMVKGSSLSQQAATALAIFCQKRDADPLTHIDVLGGKPYCNAEYWRERAATHPRFVEFVQRNITDEAARRKHWGAPDDAIAVWETDCVYYMANAPLAAIKAGKVPHDEAIKWMRPATECNWAGNVRTMNTRKGVKQIPDTVGVHHPHATARSRSLRKAAQLAFGSWMKDEELAARRAHTILEAEWEDLDTDVEPETNPDSVSVGAGDTQASTTEPDPVEKPAESVELLTDARKRYMATLRELKLSKDRKAWEQRRDFPASVKDWRLKDFDRADGLLLDRIRNTVVKLCEETGTDLEALANMLWGIAAPDYAKHWTQAHKMLEQKKQGMTVADEYNGEELDL